MPEYHVDGVVIESNAELNELEIDEMMKSGRDAHGDDLARIVAEVKGDFIDTLRYPKSNADFERIRRITGYLVGTLDRFNDGKRAEEHDRVKHNVTQGQ